MPENTSDAKAESSEELAERVGVREFALTNPQKAA
jgi:hypothetical protein